jgi:hypothetical protein
MSAQTARRASGVSPMVLCLSFLSQWSGNEREDKLKRKLIEAPPSLRWGLAGSLKFRTQQLPRIVQGWRIYTASPFSRAIFEIRWQRNGVCGF